MRELKQRLSDYLDRAARGDAIQFLTFDGRQARAARSLGFTVLGA